MGELHHKIKQLAERRALDLHRRMLTVEHNAVLVVIHIGAVLKVPTAFVDRQGDNTVIFARGMVHAARIALVFLAELALRVGALRREARCRDGLRVFFRLREVDCDIQIAVRRFGDPFQIARDAVAADIVGILAETIKSIVNKEFIILFLLLTTFADLKRVRLNNLCF